MSHSRFDIFVKGLEDIYISDNPTYTYFSSVYRNISYTSFRTTEISTPINSSGFGKTSRITLESLKGDIINNIFIRFTFPYTTDPDEYIQFTRYIMYTMFDYIDLYIGGQLIERLTGDFMLQYMKLKSSEDDWTTIINNTRASEIKKPSMVYYEPASQSYPLSCTFPIPFYFYKKDYLGIPIGALIHQHVELEFSIKPIHTLINNAYALTKSAIDSVGYDITNISALSETTTLSDKSIFDKKMTYVIRQTQLQKATIPVTESIAANVAFTNSITKFNSFNDFYLSAQYLNDFNNFYALLDIVNTSIVSESWNVNPAYFIYRDICNATANNIFEIDSSKIYSTNNEGYKAAVVYDYNIVSSRTLKDYNIYSNLITSNIVICRSNIIAGNEAGARGGFRDLIPAANVLLADIRIVESNISIAYNASNISTSIAKNNNSVTSEVNIPLNFTNPVKELFIFIKNDPSLGANDYNHLYYDFKNRYRSYYENNYDYTQYQHLESACLRFNNQIAFDHDYMYLQSYEPYKNYPNSSYVRGYINFKNGTVNGDYNYIADFPFYYMYSFSMYPQNSYPSGQINFSRIRYKNLALRLYPSSHKRFVRIYARSYNVLVVNDGIAGLMFTNNSDYDYTFDMTNTIPD